MQEIITIRRLQGLKRASLYAYPSLTGYFQSYIAAIRRIPQASALQHVDSIKNYHILHIHRDYSLTGQQLPLQLVSKYLAPFVLR